MERVAELVRLRRLVTLAALTGTLDPVTAERIALEPGEQVVEDLLADLAGAARRQLQALTVAGQVAGLLEPSSERVERVERADGVVAHQVARLAAVDAGEVTRAVDVGEGILHALHGVEAIELGEGPVKVQRRVAAEPDAIPEAARQEEVEVRGKLREVEQEPVVAQECLHHRFELGPLLGAHRAQERLHRGHPIRELVEDVVERARAREEPAVPGEELRDIRVAATDPLAHEGVEIADHLAMRLEVLGRHRADRIAHPADELVEDLLAEALDEGLEPLARGGLEEVVLAQVADPFADVRRQGIEALEATGRHVTEHAPKVRVRGGVRRLARALQPVLDAGPLLLHDLRELASDVAEHVAQVVPLAQLLASARQPVHELLETGQVRAGRVVRPPAALHQPPERLGQVAFGHDVVGQGRHDLVGIEVGQLLAPVPARVPRAPGQRRILGSVAAPVRREATAEVPRIRGVGRHRR